MEGIDSNFYVESFHFSHKVGSYSIGTLVFGEDFSVICPSMLRKFNVVLSDKFVSSLYLPSFTSYFPFNSVVLVYYTS